MFYDTFCVIKLIYTGGIQMNVWNLYTTKEMKPLGWIKRQLQIQARGLSGNLDKMWPDVRDSAWIGGDREGWERVPYWLDGFIPLAYLLEDADMIARAQKYIEAILAMQKPDGWICPCDDEKRSKYDTWAVQLISKVLTVYFDCTGDERIPEVLYKVLKNYYELLQDGSVHLFAWGKHRWFECFIAIRFIYARYPEKWLIELAELLAEQGADYNTYVELWKRPLNRWRMETHIVNLMMMLKSEAVSHELLGREYTDNAEYLRGVLDRYNGTVFESFTGDECLSGLSPIQGTELCAIVEQMFSYELLYAHTGDAKWAERLEVLAFNALPATISEDMWTHQYLQMSNQIACQRFPGRSLFRSNNGEAHIFGLEPHFGCCAANHNQGWPKLALFAFLHQGNTVINSLMIPSVLTTDKFSIRLETDYPFVNTMRYTVESSQDFTFRIRIPSFAQNLSVNGQPVETRDQQFEIHPGKTVLNLAFETKPYLKKRPHDLYAVQNGSLIFSVPIAYKKEMYEYEKNGVERKFPYCDYELIPQSDWNYAYCTDNFKTERKEPGAVPFSGEMPPVTIAANVQQISWGLEEGFETVCAKRPESVEPISDVQQIQLIPYGCAKLRMTEMPLINETDTLN